MGNWTGRIIGAVLAGLTFLGSHIPADMALNALGTLPAATWIWFVVNVLAGLSSPDVLRKVTGNKEVKL